MMERIRTHEDEGIRRRARKGIDMSHSMSRGIEEIQTAIPEEIDGSQAADAQRRVPVEGQFDHLALRKSFGSEGACVVLRISWSELACDARTDDELCGRWEE